ncbi:hypothetical protein Pla108_02340 [Botrimarina colliarenosi]|uniref:Uncharacterized protein n=1 Tax=Botrimarina colliarenosi TaxID=2528001 RepID=A0A5C6AI40_9BACT|nr:hypothetical protein [Botrimarina colliarenosi]TWT99299.1 hypothetical protein Pla108_02340 [Botrimarina colliarenosi]
MTRRILMLAVAVVALAGSVASAGHVHFGRMAFIHHSSPSQAGH